MHLAPHECRPADSSRGAPKIGAIVLAAGYSSRMGCFKPLLPLNGGSAILSSLRSLKQAGVQEIVVVLGHRADELRPIVESAGANWVLNEAFADGMFSSVRTGARALAGSIDACFLLPADIPLVRPSTLRLLAAALLSRPHNIVYPVFAGHRGHPPLISQGILDKALPDDESGPLSALLARHEHQALDVPVPDEAIHMDMDRPEDYDALARLAPRRDIPTEAECAAILSMFDVASDIVDHSYAVAGVATSLAEALRVKSLALDRELVRAGALLHDLRKGQRRHAEAGAAILDSLGFARVAAIVAEHMEPVDDRPQINESTIVFLADKLVRRESYVGVEERFRPALARFAGDPEALAAAQRRKAKACAIQSLVETVLGAPVGTLQHTSAMKT